MAILVTGSAGFIGFHVAQALLSRGDAVVGVDVVDDYYDPGLKEARLLLLRAWPGFVERRLDLADREAVAAAFAAVAPRRVIHLAAQAGVRYSLQNPAAYIDANLVGFGNVLEGCRHAGTEHLVYASSSSVYGANGALPLAETQGAVHPLSLYAATKRANEAMAHAYAHLFRLPCTGLRFFTVYGPWGRPDMALFRFTEAMLRDAPIPLYNQGAMQRDFTYIDDVVAATLRVCDRAPVPDPDWNPRTPDPDRSGVAPFRVYNVGGGATTPLLELVRTLEQALGRRARTQLLPMQPGDVAATLADGSALWRDFGAWTATPVSKGVPRFVAWYKGYYDVA